MDVNTMEDSKKLAVFLGMNQSYLSGGLTCIRSIREYNETLPIIVNYYGENTGEIKQLLKRYKHIFLVQARGDPLYAKLLLLTDDITLSLFGTRFKRILYLDSDTLVRDDLEKILIVDMQGKSIAAVQDIGEPMGPRTGKTEPSSYFNAGVILFDVEKVLSGKNAFREFLKSSPKPEYLTHKEQDLLNCYFKGRWHHLPLVWNVQGIGLYAQCRVYTESEWRPCLYTKEELRSITLNAKIVHFTGKPKPWENNVTSHVNPFKAEWNQYAVDADVPVAQRQAGIDISPMVFPKIIHDACAPNSWAIVVPVKNPKDPKAFEHIQKTSFPTGTTVFIAIDFPNDPNTVPKHLECQGVNIQTYVFPKTSPFQVWPIYNYIVRDAYRHGFQYFLLSGDDVEFQGDAAFQAVEEEFEKTKNFGCVALRDRSSPGFPSFPVVSRYHVEIFQGFCPPDFINQDADPWVWSLYRRFNASRFADAGLNNKIGGAIDNPRYERVHVSWKNQTLEKAVQKVEQTSFFPRRPTIDIVIPCFRANVNILRDIIELTSQHDDIGYTKPQYIVIVDNPKLDLPKKNALKQLEENRNEVVRVRFNEKNLGASGSRNRGIEESDADWILFLDDDVVPQRGIVTEYLKKILKHGESASGFVGLSKFPTATTQRTRAFHLSHIGFFWTVASLREYPPWGVTANLVLRRTSNLSFRSTINTGGGEDIAICIDIVRETGKPLISAPEAMILHPWWKSGLFSPWRFFQWTQGDRFLWEWYPEYTYLDWPNGAEVLVISTAVYMVLTLFFSFVKEEERTLETIMSRICHSALFFFAMSISILLIMASTGNFITPEVPLPSFREKTLASLFRLVVDTGHLFGTASPCKRFDWWLGTRNYQAEPAERSLCFFQFFFYTAAAIALLASF